MAPPSACRNAACTRPAAERWAQRGSLRSLHASTLRLCTQRAADKVYVPDWAVPMARLFPSWFALPRLGGHLL